MKHVVRPVPLMAAFAVLGAAILLVVKGHGAWWVIAAGVIGPDLTFLAALGAPEHGLMPARVVRPYNLVHQPAGPIAAFALSVSVGNPTAMGFSFAWASHLLWDRGVGYGMRARDGSIIPPGRRAMASMNRREHCHG